MDEHFLEEEMRSGYLVTSKRKRIWSVELEILEMFDKICKLHNLKYYAAYGTMLGAVRHKGFIPWDDDIDVFMFRDDYTKFEEIAPKVIKTPYSFQGPDNGYVLSIHSKIRDSRTTALEYKDAPKELNQGIFIDIFPLDDVLDEKNMNPVVAEVQKLLWQIANYPKKMQRLVELGQKFILDADVIMTLCNAGIVETMRQFELFNAENFGISTKVNLFTSELYGITKSMDREWFKEVIYLPFENMYIPVPKNYEKILRGWYGDYLIPVQGKSAHEGTFMDPDKPYTDYL